MPTDLIFVKLLLYYNNLGTIVFFRNVSFRFISPLNRPDTRGHPSLLILELGGNFVLHSPWQNLAVD